MKIITIFVMLLLIASCGPSASDKNKTYLDQATTALSSNNCDEALSYISKITNGDSDADYIQVKASAYACKAGFSEITFFSSDISLLDTSSMSKIIPSLVKFSTSVISSGTDSSYTNLQTAIDAILYAGGVTAPSAAARLTTFGSTVGNDLNLQAMYMILAQLGKFFYYYGNASHSTGAKGVGTQGNVCIFTYDDATALTLVNLGLTGPCVNPPVGHADLNAASNANKVKILCQAAVLFGNLIDILNHTTISTSSDTGSLTSISSTITTPLCSSGLPQVQAICSLVSQSVCESTYAVGASFSDLQLFYAGFIESYFL